MLSLAVRAVIMTRADETIPLPLAPRDVARRANGGTSGRRRRTSGDLGIWIRPTPDNADRVLDALRRFGAPLHDLQRDDLTCTDTVFQIGVPPARVDILAGISGVVFDDAWKRRLIVSIDGMDLPVIARADFIANKRAAGRAKDLLDLALLDEAGAGE